MTVRTPLRGRSTTSAVTSSDEVNWRLRGSCGDVDPELFFPAGQGPRFEYQVQGAKQVCGQCPVRDVCLDWALETRQDTGVWGGTSEQERRQIHKRRPPLAHREGKSAVEAILGERMDEFVAAQAADPSAGHIARELGTNTTVVYAVMKVLSEQATQLDAASEAVAS